MDRKPQVMVFRPRMDEFKDFPRFIAYMEELGAHKVGLAKVIPPKEWIPRKSGYDNIELTIPAPIKQQCIYGSKGTFKVFNLSKKAMTVKEYQQMANSDKYRPPANRGFEDLERKFWSNITINQPIYGADISGTVTDADQHVWNIGHLGTILDCISDVRIEGVNTAYLYFGMWKAMFAWHTEDMDLYSINYLHDGAPKAWYGIAPQHGRRFERLAAGLFPSDAKQCCAFLRHKMFLITPRTLRDNSIPFCQTWQEKGEFMITFPYAYHAGYNLGYNCAESTNFASERWIEYGKYCTMCHCNSDMVRISMDPFVREFQPDRFELWRAGLEVGTHPEDELSKLYSRPRYSAARPPKSAQPQLPVQETHKDNVTKLQVSRRIPVMKLPVKACTSDLHKDVVMPDVSEADTGTCSTSVNGRTVPDESQQSALTSNSSVVENVHKKASVMTTHKDQADSHKDIVKRLRLQKHAKDGLLASPIGMRHLQNIATDVSETDTSTCSTSINVRTVPDESQQSVLTSNISVVENVHRKASVMMTGKDQADNQKDIVKRLKLQKHAKHSLLASPVGTRHLPNVTTFGVECLGDKTAKVTCVSSGLVSLPSPVLSGFSQTLTPTLSFALYTPFIKSGQSQSGSHLTRVLSPLHTTSLLPTACSNLVQSSTAPNADVCSMDSSVIDTEVVETVTGQSCECKHSHTSLKKRSQTVNAGGTPISRQLSSVADLLQFRPANISAEIAYNRYEAVLQPHCCVCSLLVSGNDRQPVSSIAKISVPLVLPGVFVSRTGHRQQAADCVPMSSLLAVCSHCHVCIHQRCYGETLCPLSCESSQWLCDRCFCGNFTDACYLCELRGGALKRTTSGRWVHIICVLAVPEFGCVDVHQKFVAVSVAVSAQRKLCVYCRQRGLLVECSRDSCMSAFHVTCGHAVGAKFEVTQSPFAVSVTCSKHKLQSRPSQKRRHANMPAVATGDHVIAKHKNGRYYRAIVLFVSDVVYYKVAFDDGTYSNDMYPEDIELPEDSIRPPAIGSSVQVRWVDGQLYSAVFRGINNTSSVEVQFEDGSVLSTERTKVWAESEELPASVASRLSEATETKYNLFVPSPEAVKSRTRQRKLQYIKDDNFVMLSGRI